MGLSGDTSSLLKADDNDDDGDNDKGDVGDAANALFEVLSSRLCLFFGRSRSKTACPKVLFPLVTESPWNVYVLARPPDPAVCPRYVLSSRLLHVPSGQQHKQCPQQHNTSSINSVKLTLCLLRRKMMKTMIRIMRMEVETAATTVTVVDVVITTVFVCELGVKIVTQFGGHEGLDLDDNDDDGNDDDAGSAKDDR